MTPDASDLCVFAVKRGNTTKRFDVEYCLKEKAINLTTNFPVIKFGQIIDDIYRYPTFYGIEYISDGVGVLKGENLTREGEWIKLNELNYISTEISQKYSRTVLKPGDLIMTVRGEVGKVGIVDKNLEGYNINANVIKISLKEEIDGIAIYPRYIWQYLNSNIGNALIRKQVAGGVQETITVSGISDIDIVLPEYRIQIDITTQIDNFRKSKDYKFQQAKELLNGMSNYILSTLNLNLSDYQQRLCVSVRVSEIVNNGTFSAEYYHPERMMAIHALKAQKNLKIMQLADIVNFCREIVSSIDNKAKYLGLAGVESQTGELSAANEEATGQAFTYQTGDVLYGRLRPYLNKVLLAEEPGICSTEFHVMRVKISHILPEYLSAIMRSDLIIAQTKHMMTGNTHPRISKDDVKNLYIPVPELSIQEAIVSELGHRREKARTLKRESEQGWKAAKAQFVRELLEN